MQISALVLDQTNFYKTDQVIEAPRNQRGSLDYFQLVYSAMRKIELSTLDCQYGQESNHCRFKFSPAIHE